MWFVIGGVAVLVVGIFVYVIIWMVRMGNPEFAEKDRLKNENRLQQSKEVIRQSEEIIQRNKEVDSRTDEILQRNKEGLYVLENLTIQINRKVFTASETQEINVQKERWDALRTQFTSLTSDDTAIKKQSTRHALSINSHSDKNVATIAQLETESIEIDRQIRALFPEDIATLNALKQWVALGQQRPDNYNQHHFDN